MKTSELKQKEDPFLGLQILSFLKSTNELSFRVFVLFLYKLLKTG